MHPLLEEFCRVRGLNDCRPEYFNSVQRRLRDDIQPLLDEREMLLSENADLKDKLAKLTARKEKAA